MPVMESFRSVSVCETAIRFLASIQLPAKVLRQLLRSSHLSRASALGGFPGCSLINSFISEVLISAETDVRRGGVRQEPRIVMRNQWCIAIEWQWPAIWQRIPAFRPGSVRVSPFAMGSLFHQLQTMAWRRSERRNPPQEKRAGFSLHSLPRVKVGGGMICRTAGEHSFVLRLHFATTSVSGVPDCIMSDSRCAATSRDRQAQAECASQHPNNYRAWNRSICRTLV